LCVVENGKKDDNNENDNKLKKTLLIKNSPSDVNFVVNDFYSRNKMERKLSSEELIKETTPSPSSPLPSSSSSPSSSLLSSSAYGIKGILPLSSPDIEELREKLLNKITTIKQSSSSSSSFSSSSSSTEQDLVDAVFNTTNCDPFSSDSSHVPFIVNPTFESVIKKSYVKKIYLLGHSNTPSPTRCVLHWKTDGVEISDIELESEKIENKISIN
jgi:hypothetical protein